MKWEDVVGFDKEKQMLLDSLESLQYSSSPTSQGFQSALVYGAPGIGKTFLLKALSTQTKYSYYYLQTINLVCSVRRLDKQLTTLFEMARRNKPYVLILDDLDYVLFLDKQRNESEALKTEFLAQMRNLEEKGENVFVIVTSSRPWKLDKEVLKR